MIIKAIIRSLFLKKVIKIKPLLPVLKENKRYVLYKVDSNNYIQNMNKAIEDNLRNFIGDLGLARAATRFIKTKKDTGIIQVNHKYVNEIKTGLALIDNINEIPVRIRTLRVSGILNKLTKVFSEV